ncbi:MAG: NAD-dependent epimerase/dehydratase family protein [Streptosporangiaceae bacterium]
MSLRVVVVVGATGQIGRPLCHALIGAGHAVIIPARASALGYCFRFPAPDAALRDLLDQPGRTTTAAR